MPATTVAQALPYVNWVVLASLALGSFAFVAVTRELTDASRGYLTFTSVLAALLAALAWLSDSALPQPSGLAIHGASDVLNEARQIGLVAFVVLCVVYVFALRGRLPTKLVGAVAIGVGLVSLVAAALGWAPSTVDGVPFAVQLSVLSAVTGGALAAIVLGHWYLVTPKLSPTPLVLQSRLLLAAVALQVALFVLWTTIGGGPGQMAFTALTGSAALLVWLRLVVTLVFPLVLIYMAMRTAQTRSMESATGLLYINLAAVAAGTIGAAALYVTSGLLV